MIFEYQAFRSRPGVALEEQSGGESADSATKTTQS